MDPIVNLRKEKEVSKKESDPPKTEEEIMEIEWVADYSFFVSNTWRKVAILLLIAIWALFIIFKVNFISIVLFGLILAVFFIRIYSFKPELKIGIKNRGVELDGHLIPYEDIDSFWITYELDGIQELSIKQDNWYLPQIKIPIYDENPVQIRDLLIKYIPESEHIDNFIDAVGRRLGV